jgi:hypothetical protein
MGWCTALFFLEIAFRRQKATSKLLNDAFMLYYIAKSRCCLGPTRGKHSKEFWRLMDRAHKEGEKKGFTKLDDLPD